MRYLAAALIVFLVPAIAQPQTLRRNESAEKEVAQLERDLHAARLRNDVAAVNWFFAPDHYSVDTAGRRQDAGNQGKGPFNTTADGEQWATVEIAEQRVRVHGNTALSTHMQRATIRARDGTSRPVTVVSTHVWMNRDGRWQLVLSHATRVQ